MGPRFRDLALLTVIGSQDAGLAPFSADLTLLSTTVHLRPSDVFVLNPDASPAS